MVSNYKSFVPGLAFAEKSVQQFNQKNYWASAAYAVGAVAEVALAYATSGTSELAIGSLHVAAKAAAGKFAALLPKTAQATESGALHIVVDMTQNVPINTGSHAVYASMDGQTQYIGITNNVARRAGEHLREKGIFITEIPGLSNLSLSDAKAVE